MNKLFISCLLFASLATFVSCSSGGGDDGPPPPPPPPVAGTMPVPRITQDTAMAYFNTYFRATATSKHLYYTTSILTEIAQGWTQAIYWDMNMNAYKRAKNAIDTAANDTWKTYHESWAAYYLKQINDIYTSARREYANFNWDIAAYGWGQDGFIYDDIMWWVISLARAYEITGEEKYLTDAKSSFAWTWREAYDPVNGGMFWFWKGPGWTAQNPVRQGKNSCVNYPTVIGAMTLYNITGDNDYFDKAKNIYNFSQNNLFRASDGCVADGPGNFGETYTYNQGTSIGASVMLYVKTGEQKYLDNAILAADYTWNRNQSSSRMSDANGILPAEGSWNEQGILKSVFAQYIIRLIEDGNQTQYLDWMRKNIALGWKNRDPRRHITYRDYKVPCPAGEIQSAEASSIPALLQVIPLR